MQEVFCAINEIGKNQLLTAFSALGVSNLSVRCVPKLCENYSLIMMVVIVLYFSAIFHLKVGN